MGGNELTSLSNGDDIMAGQDGRDTVTLDRSRGAVLAQLDVLHHHGMETGVLELQLSVEVRMGREAGLRRP